MTRGLLVSLIISGVGYATASPTAAAPPSACRFVDESLVPQLAMGVRRLGDSDVDMLRLYADLQGSPSGRELPLFRPYFVVESRVDSNLEEWHLLQEGYTADAPLGWAKGENLHLFQSRYAYTFAQRRRDPRVDMHDDSKESYDRLLAQIQGNPQGAEETVVVKEREGAEIWDPIAIDDIVPFVELRIPSEARNREYPDTTPTFRFGIPVENRLVHLGAVCGGAVDRSTLEKRRQMMAEEKGLEMVFVIDDTVSMAPFSQVVARFIRDAAAVAGRRTTPVRIAVCSYRDGPERPKDSTEQRVTVGEFREVKEASDVGSLAEDVEKLGHFLPPGEFANPPERMLEGLRESLATLDFQRGATLFVVVLGDTGHEPADPDKERLIDDIAMRIDRAGASVFFMHVGRRRTPDELLFKHDCDAVAAALTRLDGSAGLVSYQPAETGNLQETLREASAATELRRMQMRQMIQRMESRSPYTEPGPKFVDAMTRHGLDFPAYDARYLQFFVPSRAWLFHPSSDGSASALPQLRELFLLAPEEQQAVTRFFESLRDSFARGRQIDGTALIMAFADDLESSSAHSFAGQRVRDAWRRMPQEHRSVGVFMEDVFGLRVKAALPYPSIAYAKDHPVTAREIGRLSERIDALTRAIESPGKQRFWFDAGSLVP